MKLCYILPFLFFGLNGSLAQGSYSVFKLEDYKKNILSFDLLPSLDGVSRVVRLHYDIKPKNGVLDLYAFFRINHINDSSIYFDSTAFRVQIDSDEDGVADLVIEDIDGDGILETIMWKNPRKPEEKKLKLEKEDKS